MSRDVFDVLFHLVHVTDTHGVPSPTVIVGGLDDGDVDDDDDVDSYDNDSKYDNYEDDHPSVYDSSQDEDEDDEDDVDVGWTMY
jgi:hypothetical protein